MYYNVLKANDIIDLNCEKFQKKVLLEADDSCFGIIAIKKDEIIDTHTSAKDAAVYVIDGEIELHFDAQKYEIGKGEILIFKKDTEHKVLAKKDSKFFIIRLGE